MVSNVRGDGRVLGGRGGNGNGDGGKGKGREWRKKGMNVLGISEFLPLPCSAASPFTHTHTLALTLTHYDIVIHWQLHQKTHAKNIGVTLVSSYLAPCPTNDHITGAKAATVGGMGVRTARYCTLQW